MLILEVAIGIVLGYILLALISTEEFWQIVGALLLIGLIIIGLGIFVSNIDTLAPILGVAVLLLIPVGIYMARVRYKRFAKIKITKYYMRDLIIENQDGERFSINGSFLLVTAEEAAKRFFQDNNLNLDDYSVKMVKKDEDKEVWLYTRKQKKKKKLSIWANK